MNTLLNKRRLSKKFVLITLVLVAAIAGVAACSLVDGSRLAERPNGPIPEQFDCGFAEGACGTSDYMRGFPFGAKHYSHNFITNTSHAPDSYEISTNKLLLNYLIFVLFFEFVFLGSYRLFRTGTYKKDLGKLKVGARGSTWLMSAGVILSVAAAVTILCYVVNNSPYRLIRDLKEYPYQCTFDCALSGEKKGEWYSFYRGKVGFPFAYKDHFTGPQEDQLISPKVPTEIGPEKIWKDYVVFVLAGELLALPLILKVRLHRAHLRD